MEYYCKKKKCLPEFYVIFKNSYFDIKQFYCKYYVQLNYNAINNYVKEEEDIFEFNQDLDNDKNINTDAKKTVKRRLVRPLSSTQKPRSKNLIRPASAVK